ncbi:MAG: tetratricopeptide repeat protein [Proteobacteria bacterium]|nr:tetratricopeptide repeat protein [Desulfobulbaceae bacterium]MBU4151642.1 tetratricopeptide repeat protein [Pseudomonadota bacterium]
MSAARSRMARCSGRWRWVWTAGALVLVVAVVYGRVVGFEFLDYDDNLNVYENPLLSNISASNLLRFWQKPFEGLYIPLTYTVWALLTKISSFLPGSHDRIFNPQLFHAANLLVHAANTVVLFSLLRVVVKSYWPAVGGALLFALHPLQVESVAWVTGFKAVLYGFFSLMTLLLYVLHGNERETGASSSSGQWLLFYLASFGCFVSAMLTMPSAVVLPLVAGIIAIVLMARPWRVVVRELIPWLVLVAPVALVTKGAQPDIQQVFLPTLGQRFLVAGDTLSFYLGKFLFPFRLGPDYGRTPELVLGDTPWVYLTGLAPYLLAGILLWRCRNAWVWAAVGIFVVVLAPVLGFLSFTFQDMSTVADRYCYLAMIGPAVFCGWALCRWPGRWVVIAPFIIILITFAVISAAQTRHWRDSFVFNTYALSVNPRSWLAFHNLGLWYFENGQMDTAIAHYERALALKPNSFKAYNNLGMIYDRLGQKDKAIESYKKALLIKPNYPLVCNNIAVIYKGLKRYDEAFSYYQKALALDPEFAEVHANLGNLYRVLGKAEDAVASYRQALALRPNNVELANDIGLIYAEEGRLLEAIDYYRKAVKVNPEFAEAHANMGVAYKILGQTPAAIAAFRQAVAHDPGLVEAYINLGYLLSSAEGYAEAIQMYQQAGVLSPDNEIPHYALGTLYGELGRDREALDAFQRAVAANPDFGPGYLALSRLFLRTKDYDRAVEFADRAKKLGYADRDQLDALAPYRKR